MKILCVLGIHDFEVIDQSCESAVDYDVANELDPLKPGEHRPQTGGRPLFRKWCLRCGKTIDEIKPYRARRLNRMQKIIDRWGLDRIDPPKGRIPPPPPPPRKSDPS